MKGTPAFELRSLTRLPISPTQSRVETNITSDPDVEHADESVAFSVLIEHKKNPSLRDLQSSALQRALDILESQRNSQAELERR
jgi:hypothetical protein